MSHDTPSCERLMPLLAALQATARHPHNWKSFELLGTAAGHPAALRIRPASPHPEPGRHTVLECSRGGGGGGEWAELASGVGSVAAAAFVFAEGVDQPGREVVRLRLRAAEAAAELANTVWWAGELRRWEHSRTSKRFALGGAWLLWRVLNGSHLGSWRMASRQLCGRRGRQPSRSGRRSSARPFSCCAGTAPAAGPPQTTRSGPPACCGFPTPRSPGRWPLATGC